MTNKLTAHQLHALQLIGKGLTYKEIADILFISADTVRNILYVARRKLYARSSIHAVVLALHQGLLKLEDL